MTDAELVDKVKNATPAELISKLEECENCPVDWCSIIHTEEKNIV